jgi:hypothetical protein
MLLSEAALGDISMNNAISEVCIPCCLVAYRCAHKEVHVDASRPQRHGCTFREFTTTINGFQDCLLGARATKEHTGVPKCAALDGGHDGMHQGGS